MGEFRILLKPSTWKRVRLGEGVCRHVFLGCNAANERVVLKRQRHSWDWEKDEHGYTQAQHCMGFRYFILCLGYMFRRFAAHLFGLKTNC